MTSVELVTTADVQLMQGLAQRVTATRPDLVNSDASFGELGLELGLGARPRRRKLAAPAVVLWRGSGGVELGPSSAPGEAQRRVGEGRHRLSRVAGPSRPRRTGAGSSCRR